METTHNTDCGEIQNWFDALCDLDAPEQMRRLDEAGLPDNLRQAIVELLSRDKEAASQASELSDLSEHTRQGAQALVPPLDAAQPPTPDTRPELAEGERVGPWVVLDLLGRGGMGAVYRAQRADGQFAQEVAIKVLKGPSDESAQRALARERRALASVSHPNFARILDAGLTSSGKPYLALDLVEGIQIHRFCKREQLHWRAVVGMFRQICAALADAHESLVLHCDLKPGNILVTSQGVPMILDFGIAKTLSAATLATPEQTHSLTPRFASPEQAAGLAITTASDVYALGKVLKLCLSRIHLNRWARAELDAVVERSTQVDPKQRYSTMGALDAELARLLADAPVQALPRTWRYRARKLLQRRTAAVLVGAVAACAVFGFMAESHLQRTRALAAEATAQAQLLRATQAQQTAQSERDRAAKASARAEDSALRAQGEEARANEALQLAALERDRAVRASVAAQLAAVAAQSAEAKSAKDADIARAAQGVAQIERAQAGAVRDFLVKIFEPVNEQPTGPRQVTAYSLLETARLELAKQQITDPRTRSDLLQALVDIYERLADVEVVRKLYEEVAQIESDPTHGRPAVRAIALSRVALAHANNNNGRAAEPPARESLAIRLGLFGASHLDVADAHNSLSNALIRQGRFAEALEQGHAALKIRQQLLPATSDMIGSNLANLANVYLGMNKHDEALRLWDEAITIHTAAHSADHPYTLNSLEGKGITLRGLRRFAEAEAVLRALYDTQVRVNGADAERAASAAIRLAEVYVDQGRLAPAQEYAHISMRILSKPPPSERSMRFAMAANYLASVMEWRGNPHGAVAHAREGLAVRERTLKPDDQGLINPRLNLARVLGKAGLADEGLVLVQRVIDALLVQNKPESPQLATAWLTQADLFAQAGRAKEARLALDKSRPPPATERLRLLVRLRVEAAVLQVEGKSNEARAKQQERHALAVAHHGPAHPATIGAELDVARAHTFAGDPAAAAVLAQNLLRHMPPQADSFDPHGQFVSDWRAVLTKR